MTLKGNDKNPATPPAIIDALRGINPWVETADFDKHGYGLVKADQNELRLQPRAHVDDQEEDDEDRDR